MRRVRLPSPADVQDVIGFDRERDVAQAQRHDAAIGVGLEDRESVVLRAKPHSADRTWPAKSSGVSYGTTAIAPVVTAALVRTVRGSSAALPAT